MKQNNWTLVRGARQLLTLHHHRGPRRAGELANLGVIREGSVLLHNDTIEAVGPTRSVENMAHARDADEIDAAGRVVMPAFIDTHACVIPAPTNQGDAAKTVRTLPASRLEAQADGLLKTMARHGSATIGALSCYGLDSSGALKTLRALRGRDGRPLDIISILRVANLPAEETAEQLLRCVKSRKLASVAQVRFGDRGIPPSGAETFLEMARSLGFSVRLEMGPEHDPGLVDAAIRMPALAISATGPFKACDIESLSYSQTIALLLPALPSPEGTPSYVRQLIDRGGLVALGSGINPESGATASMQTAVQLACERLGLTIAEAISAATINAAWALGVGPRTGSLEHGKLADLILLNASDYREIPLLKGTNLTYSMIKRGVVVFKEDFPGWPDQA